MKNAQNISWSQLTESVRHYSKYIFVVMIFFAFVLYSFIAVPHDAPKKSKSSADQSADRIAWDITTEKPEKNFTGVLQGRSGDWYRMNVSAMANHDSQIDVTLYSVFSGDVSVGSFDIAKSDDFQYHEILFQIPTGTFSDVRFVLRGDDSRESWSYVGVKLSEFALSRLSVKNRAEADRLVPTLSGNIEHTTKTLVLSDQAADPNLVFESRFVAEADFTENIRLNMKGKSKKNSYVLELRKIVNNGQEHEDISVKKIILEPGELGSDQDEWGNELIAIPARLERGKEYSITLTNTGDALRSPVLLPLEDSQEITLDGENIAAITLGRYMYAAGGAISSGAKLEDFGDEILYSYSLSGGMNDFFDLFDTEGSVKFDAKEKIVVGKQQQRTSFTYRFFTVYPFEKFMLAARQMGDVEKEVKLEYSFDNAFWREVPATQINNEPQVFSLVLSGTGDQHIVYIRVSYNGEDRKTGSFGLDQLLVRAELIRK